MVSILVERLSHKDRLFKVLVGDFLGLSEESVASFGGFLSNAHIFRPIRYRARRGQVTCPQDKPVYSRCAVRDLPTAPRLEAFGLTR